MPYLKRKQNILTISNGATRDSEIFRTREENEISRAYTYLSVRPPASFLDEIQQALESKSRSELKRGRKGKTAIMHSGVDARPGPLLPLPGASPAPCSGRRVPWPRSGLGAALRRPNSPRGRLRFERLPAGDLCKRAHRVRIPHPVTLPIVFYELIIYHHFVSSHKFLWAQSLRITYDM